MADVVQFNADAKLCILDTTVPMFYSRLWMVWYHVSVADEKNSGVNSISEDLKWEKQCCK